MRLLELTNRETRCLVGCAASCFQTSPEKILDRDNNDRAASAAKRSVWWCERVLMGRSNHEIGIEWGRTAAVVMRACNEATAAGQNAIPEALRTLGTEIGALEQVRIETGDWEGDDDLRVVLSHIAKIARPTFPDVHWAPADIWKGDKAFKSGRALVMRIASEAIGIDGDRLSHVFHTSAARVTAEIMRIRCVTIPAAVASELWAFRTELRR